MRTYVRNGPRKLSTREGSFDARRAPVHDRSARRAPGAVAEHDLLLGARSADPGLGPWWRVSGRGESSGQPSDAAQVPAAARAGVPRGARGIRWARGRPDVPGLRLPVSRGGVQAQPKRGLDLQL